MPFVRSSKKRGKSKGQLLREQERKKAIQEQFLKQQEPTTHVEDVPSKLPPVERVDKDFFKPTYVKQLHPRLTRKKPKFLRNRSLADEIILRRIRGESYTPETDVSKSTEQVFKAYRERTDLIEDEVSSKMYKLRRVPANWLSAMHGGNDNYESDNIIEKDKISSTEPTSAAEPKVTTTEVKPASKQVAPSKNETQLAPKPPTVKIPPVTNPQNNQPPKLNPTVTNKNRNTSAEKKEPVYNGKELAKNSYEGKLAEETEDEKQLEEEIARMINFGL